MSDNNLRRKIYVILPVHNRKSITEKFISCLVRQTYADYQLILVDDGSTDGTSEMVSELIPSVIIIRGNGNWWWAGALQEAFLWLKRKVSSQADEQDIALIINDDTSFEADYLEKIASRPIIHNTIFLTPGYAMNDPGYIAAGVHFDPREMTFQPTSNPQAVNCLPTRGLFMTVKTLLDMNGFYPKLLPHYLSDYEFSIRAYRRGLRLVVADNVKLFFDPLTTGDRTANVTGLRNYLKRIFSKRYTGNPLYFTTFILLACPPRYWIRNIYRLWYDALYVSPPGQTMVRQYNRLKLFIRKK